MSKKIHIDLNDESDLLENYNKNNVSINLLNYIIDQVSIIPKKDDIQIVINNDTQIPKNCKKIILEGLNEELTKSKRQRKNNNIKQTCLLILGITFLFLSTLVHQDSIWKELLIISGWVPVWETIEVELFQDVAGKKRRKIIKRILNCEIIETNKVVHIK